MNIESIKTSLADVAASWGAKRETLLQKTADAESRVADLKAQKDDVIVDAALGIKTAQSELSRVELALSAAEAEAERMRSALARASEREAARLEEDRVTQERIDLAKRWAHVESLATKREALAARVQARGGDYAEDVAELIKLGLEIHAAAPSQDRHSQHETAVSGQATEDAVRNMLKAQGVHWARPHLTESTPPALAEVVAAQHAKILGLQGEQ